MNLATDGHGFSRSGTPFLFRSNGSGVVEVGRAVLVGVVARFEVVGGLGDPFELSRVMPRVPEVEGQFGAGQRQRRLLRQALARG